MKTLSLILFLLTISCSSSHAEEIYIGTLVDAHSQKGSLISVEEISAAINANGVDYTLLSFRMSPSKVKEELLAINKLTDGKVRYLIPTKLGGFKNVNSSDDKAIETIKELHRESVSDNLNHVGFGEILVQHAPHNHTKLKYEGMNLNLESQRIKRAIEVVLNDNKPVTLHIELNDYESDSKKILKQLISLSNKNPASNFFLIHMGQIDFTEAEFLIKNTKNIHFLTSHADFSKERLRKKIGKAQTGWINLFKKNTNILKKKWHRLMNENPKRFVFALDNVWDKHWLYKYQEKVSKWRKALGSLDKKSASLIACGNANEYFKLDIACLSEQ